MPLKYALRNARVNSFDSAALEAIERINDIKKKQIPLARKLKMSVKLKRGLVASLQEMKENSKMYDFGPIQLRVVDTLLINLKKARSTEDLFDVWRLICYLKNDKQ